MVPDGGLSSAGSTPDSKLSHVQSQIRRLEEEARSPKDAALAHLRRFSAQENFKIGGDARVRVAPDMIAKLYKNSRTAATELEEFIRVRGLEKCHAALEMPTLGLILDRLVVASPGVEIVNLQAVEVICRKLYGLLKAFEDVKCEADWKQPKGAGSGKWKSKVKWQLLQEYDVKALESSDWAISGADQEVADRLQRRALFQKHLSKVEETGLKDD